jgi:catechol 2,3-dioxygenase-like lactoylglutathione lyase family enzyme
MSGIGIKEVAFVGYPVSDFDQAREFYGELLGMKEGMIFEEEGKVHWMEFEAGRVTIGLGLAGPHWEPGPQGGGACFEVEDLDGVLEKLPTAGVTISFEIQNYPIYRHRRPGRKRDRASSGEAQPPGFAVIELQ